MNFLEAGGRPRFLEARVTLGGRQARRKLKSLRAVGGFKHLPELRRWSRARRPRRGLEPPSITPGRKDSLQGRSRFRRLAIRKYCAASGREISGLENELIKAALKRASRANRDFGRGSVDGAKWEDADRAATKAALFGDYTGVRDSAIIRITSDGLLRTAEVAALDVSDIEIDETGTGQIHIRSSKTDQEGEGFLFFVGPATANAILSWLDVSGILEGALFPSTRGIRHWEADESSSDQIRDF